MKNLKEINVTANGPSFHHLSGNTFSVTSNVAGAKVPNLNLEI